jgi:3'-phosphoadenosine 5'-phosphosulfate sulfotransferase (PAPS reductase)/FAD synthetase
MTANRYVISCSYGNDSRAMIQWAHESGIDLFGQVTVVYCDTGWAAPSWAEEIATGEALAHRCGFETVRLTSIGMEELVRTKSGFPGNAQQFCTMFLKGLPYLQWLDEIDPQRTAVTMVGKRREESAARANTPEFVYESEYHGGRTLWHPLYTHTVRSGRTATAGGAHTTSPQKP